MAQYYYGPCPSWDFYYPYHYAPFASDFGSLKGVSAKFEKGSQPVRPLEQLMNVFPAGNAHYLPPSWGMLMTDPNSPLREYFPSNVVTDFNGKKYAWQGVFLGTGWIIYKVHTTLFLFFVLLLQAWCCCRLWMQSC